MGLMEPSFKWKTALLPAMGSDSHRQEDGGGEIITSVKIPSAVYVTLLKRPRINDQNQEKPENQTGLVFISSEMKPL